MCVHTWMHDDDDVDNDPFIAGWLLYAADIINFIRRAKCVIVVCLMSCSMFIENEVMCVVSHTQDVHTYGATTFIENVISISVQIVKY